MIDLRATLRLQFHQGFTLHDAVELVPYFARLGISHVYASPLLTARPGSMHGYDVVDPTRVNPELGGEPGLVRLVEALHGRGIGLILDIVPNHMAVGGDANPWWLDLLEWGKDSPFAKFFDIQWHSHDPLLAGQLLVPFLRTDYGEALSGGSIALHFDPEQGRFYAQHFEHRLPITPPSYGEILRSADDPALAELAKRFDALRGDSDAWHSSQPLCTELAQLGRPELAGEAIRRALAGYRCDDEAGVQRLHQLLERQHYRVASWRTAADDINWRRFFDINELGGLRVERPEVFELTHGKIFQMIEQGLVDGLRIDHVDGLANPRTYCRRLRRRVDLLLAQRPQATFGQHFPIYVEKILGYGEHLPDSWSVDGTTGYEFMNQLALLQHDPRGEQPLRELWSELGGRPQEFADEALEARRLVLGSSLTGDLEEVAQGLLQVARNDIATRDLTLASIRRALLELIVHFPVYRTYANACGRSEQDQHVFQQALDGARLTLAEADWPLLDHLDRWLGGQPLHELPPGRPRKLRARVLSRFQQLTSPVAAKAVEDTACYRAGVLLSRYDVGFDAEHFSQPLEYFHQCNRERASKLPYNQLATATHDHKRGEDSRARLAVLSERAPWYAEKVQRWRTLAAVWRGDLPENSPSADEELILYQALLGSWPLELGADDAEGLQAYLQRMRTWQQKALREAKLNSSWSAPNGEHEADSQEFLERLLTRPEGRELRLELVAAVAAIAPAGALNSLAQCLLKYSAPGVPDLYQGCEYWDFSLVDPDNRRPVDFAARVASLDGLAEPSELLAHWRDGRVKQWLIANLLAIRHARPQLFARGDYRPLEVEGEQAGRVLAFARSFGDAHLVAVVPRLAAGLLGSNEVPHIPAEHWGDTRIVLPPEFADLATTGIFPPHQPINHGHLHLAEVLAEFPVNLICLKPRQENCHEHR
ncbi:MULTISPECIES: malto-oligosyltrehalose synthase [unclassified Pseudomonas]|uniref:malto-oligosyltrehalose synthase n=1 Tax=unclassified Pseudomonas TaxID=196821 RepID=UPI002448F567|nr:MULTISPECIES: malto-oligosyltrehalose synthase [unclassified Pseudomonas]MDG9925650.1 malto-oligosyltrehalose synthase [Pseudomonas sp. GD04045]MDH0037233.1 malto-oligosyltrehalose synthase [Pseudomonas sp. GD04019]